MPDTNLKDLMERICLNPCSNGMKYAHRERVITKTRMMAS